MSRRRGSATALNASEVVAALAMPLIYSHIGICQALFCRPFPPPFFLCCLPLKLISLHWRVGRNNSACVVNRVIEKRRVTHFVRCLLCPVNFRYTRNGRPVPLVA